MAPRRPSPVRACISRTGAMRCWSIAGCSRAHVRWNSRIPPRSPSIRPPSRQSSSRMRTSTIRACCPSWWRKGSPARSGARGPRSTCSNTCWPMRAASRKPIPNAATADATGRARTRSIRSIPKPTRSPPGASAAPSNWNNGSSPRPAFALGYGTPDTSSAPLPPNSTWTAHGSSARAISARNTRPSFSIQKGLRASTMSFAKALMARGSATR